MGYSDIDYSDTVGSLKRHFSEFPINLSYNKDYLDTVPH